MARAAKVVQGKTVYLAHLGWHQIQVFSCFQSMTRWLESQWKGPLQIVMDTHSDYNFAYIAEGNGRIVARVQEKSMDPKPGQ